MVYRQRRVGRMGRNEVYSCCDTGLSGVVLLLFTETWHGGEGVCVTKINI
jgi:hypothetical protein